MNPSPGRGLMKKENVIFPPPVHWADLGESLLSSCIFFSQLAFSLEDIAAAAAGPGASPRGRRHLSVPPIRLQRRSSGTGVALT